MFFPHRNNDQIFQDLMENQRFKYGGGERFGHRGYGVSVTVRRQHLYEDSFVSLSPGEAPNLRAPIRVRMVNWAGADEQGVDGGGIFRYRILFHSENPKIPENSSLSS